MYRVIGIDRCHGAGGIAVNELRPPKAQAHAIAFIGSGIDEDYIAGGNEGLDGAQVGSDEVFQLIGTCITPVHIHIGIGRAEDRSGIGRIEGVEVPVAGAKGGIHVALVGRIAPGVALGHVDLAQYGRC